MKNITMKNIKNITLTKGFSLLIFLICINSCKNNTPLINSNKQTLSKDDASRKKTIVQRKMKAGIKKYKPVSKKINAGNAEEFERRISSYKNGINEIKEMIEVPSSKAPFIILNSFDKKRLTLLKELENFKDNTNYHNWSNLLKMDLIKYYKNNFNLFLEDKYAKRMNRIMLDLVKYNKNVEPYMNLEKLYENSLLYIKNKELLEEIKQNYINNNKEFEGTFFEELYQNFLQEIDRKINLYTNILNFLKSKANFFKFFLTLKEFRKNLLTSCNDENEEVNKLEKQHLLLKKEILVQEEIYNKEMKGTSIKGTLIIASKVKTDSSKSLIKKQIENIKLILKENKEEINHIKTELDSKHKRSDLLKNNKINIKISGLLCELIYTYKRQQYLKDNEKITNTELRKKIHKEIISIFENEKEELNEINIPTKDSKTFEIITLKSGNKIFIAFAGTVWGRDWIKNLKASSIQCDSDEKEIFCHKGFIERYKELEPKIKLTLKRIINKIKNEKIEIIIAGHSLGAGIASLTSRSLMKSKYKNNGKIKIYKSPIQKNINISTFLFAVPAIVFTKNALNQYNKLIKQTNSTTLSFIHHGDPVPPVSAQELPCGDKILLGNTSKILSDPKIYIENHSMALHNNIIKKLYEDKEEMKTINKKAIYFTPEYWNSRTILPNPFNTVNKIYNLF